MHFHTEGWVLMEPASVRVKPAWLISGLPIFEHMHLIVLLVNTFEVFAALLSCQLRLVAQVIDFIQSEPTAHLLHRVVLELGVEEHSAGDAAVVVVLWQVVVVWKGP